MLSNFDYLIQRIINASRTSTDSMHFQIVLVSHLLPFDFSDIHQIENGTHD